MDLIMKTGGVTPEDLQLINALAKSPMAGEQVYTFAVRLCDNEVDRDLERFDRAALEKLAELFVGKSGILDHNWTTEGQVARIYKTEVVTEPGQTSAGEEKCYLKGYAYMLRGEKNLEFIAEIEGGIKKEVSVGCAISRSVCSICGKEAGRCGHRKGETYDGKLCFLTLQEPTDAYEWSFVAVPAQRSAGVVKHWGGGASTPSDADIDRIAEALAKNLFEKTAKTRVLPEGPTEEETKLARARLDLEKIRFGKDR